MPALTVNGRTFELEGVDPHTTVLELLRARGLSGSKEGCAEGECGACAVVLVRRDTQGRSRFLPVNGCLTLVGSVAGGELLTVEGMRPAPDQLHPVQRAMIEQGGSQCGYCTPGFVVSLFAEYYRERGPATPLVDLEAIAGNLCRCTGYRPIRAVLQQIGPARPTPDDPFAARLGRPVVPLGPLVQRNAARRLIRPDSLDDLLGLLARTPEAKLVAGGTDVVVEINQRHARWPLLISLEAVTELHKSSVGPRWIEIGAALPLTEVEDRLAGSIPLLDELWPLFSSRLIRNRASLGGNLANASPIGDGAPVLMALDAELTLRTHEGERRIAVAEFFRGYRQTVLRPGELIVAIRIPRRQPTHAHFYKVSKRLLDDISTVSAAFALDLDDDGVVTRARLAYGGVAATPVRARSIEDALVGKPWTAATVEQVAPWLEHAFTPMSDHRGTSEYRRAMIVQLLRKFHAETELDRRIGPQPPHATELPGVLP